MPKAFNARWRGRCGAIDCDGIQAGDLVECDDDGELWHIGCMAEALAGARTPVPPVCGSCWLAHAGECP